MVSTSTGIQLMFAHASYVPIIVSRMQCHTIVVGVKNSTCNQFSFEFLTVS